MRLSRLSIASSGALLACLAYEPHGEPRSPVVILTHGLTASRESMDLLAAYLCGRGYRCLTYDVRGHLLGASEGDIQHIDEALGDLATVANRTRERFGCAECVLIGHSMGGLLSLAVAAVRDDVCAAVAIASGPHPSRGFKSPAGAAMLQQRSAYLSGVPPVTILQQLDAVAAGAQNPLRVPALHVAARGDVLVRAATVQAMAERAHAECIVIDGAHLDAQARARGAVANWLDRITAGSGAA